MQYIRCSLWLFLALAITSCVNPPDYPDEPVIVYEGISKNTIKSSTTGIKDSLIVQFSFTDGDGDISSEDSVDIFYQDSRLPGTAPTPLAFPLIPTEGTGNGISGDVFFTLINTAQVCCIFRNRLCAVDESYPVDTFSLSIYIEDRAGNRSNTIRTEQIMIPCLE